MPTEQSMAHCPSDTRRSGGRIAERRDAVACAGTPAAASAGGAP